MGTDLDDVLSKLEQTDPKWRANIYVIHQVMGALDEHEDIRARIIAVSETRRLIFDSKFETMSAAPKYGRSYESTSRFGTWCPKPSFIISRRTTYTRTARAPKHCQDHEKFKESDSIFLFSHDVNSSCTQPAAPRTALHSVLVGQALIGPT